jgi:AraC-like protein
MAGWSTVAIEDVKSYDGPGASDWKPLRHHFGIRAFGLNAWIADHAGQELVEEHDEVEEHNEGTGGHEEIYAITRGRATFTVGGETVEVPAGSILHVADPKIVRSAVAEEPGTTVICVGAEPGRAFEPSHWELRRVGG